MSTGTKFGIVLAVAAAGLLMGGYASAEDAKVAATGTVKCAGVNSCKGTSECKSAGGKGSNTCKGQNACKGQGWVTKASAAECEAAKGQVVTE